MELTSSQELFARAYAHKFCIIGAYLIDREVSHQTGGEVSVPKFIAEQQALKTVTDKIQQFLADGTFEDMYEQAWEYLKDRLPDNFNATGNLAQNYNM